MNNVLLLGNGINLVNNNQSWEKLLKALKPSINDMESQIPFPLLYEKIMLESKGAGDSKLLEKVCSNIVSLVENDLHKQIRKSSFTDIITTNYDHLLEGDNENKTTTNKGTVKENRYSIFRHTEVEGKRFWHIHGDVFNPNSILLGYEQYAGQLQKMRDYVVTGMHYTTKSFDRRSLQELIQKGQLRAKTVSWVDHFFFSDVHIIGLSLDTNEIDLWWLLNYRARAQKKLSISNTIYYYTSNQIETPNTMLLKAFGVKVEPFDIKGKYPSEDEYSELIKMIEQGNKGLNK